MAETEVVPNQEQPTLEAGTYEIIRNRLAGHGRELKTRLDRLNTARKDVFGSIETKLLKTERITTDHNCVPRDIVTVGDLVLFGYNVHFGLKTERNVSDVFAIYRFDTEQNVFRAQPLDLLQNPAFEKDFRDVYRYYKHAVFARFSVQGPHLYMVFQVGQSVTDLKAFKWLISGGSLTYIDSRSEHELKYPPQHEFVWKRTTRDQHQKGAHPHVSIEDRVFVETVGGDLTIKVENNTDSGEGIYNEEVDQKDQTLDDAEYHYAIVGNLILLKIKPYQEEKYRYFVFNEKLQTAMRLDSLKDACVLLPDDQGIIFSNGYYLQTGEYKTFDNSITNTLFERRIAASNGEDHLYAFYNRESGTYVLLQYNMISQQVQTPLVCNGFAFFHAGEMLCFKVHEQAQKHHPIQIWQTPYVGENFIPDTDTDSFLFKVGNKEIVRGMAESHEVLSLIHKEDSYANLYLDIAKRAGDILDSYFWINHTETCQLGEPLEEICKAASAAVSEYEKVTKLKQNTASETKRVQKSVREILAVSHRARFEDIHDFVKSLSELRMVRGEVISLRELRYVEHAMIDELEKEVAEQTDKLARRCVEFLLRADALAPYQKQVKEEQDKIPGIRKVAEAKKVGEDIAASAKELEMLIEIVSNLNIDDATQRTAIIDNISAIFAQLNQARAALKNKTHELMSVEAVAEFNSQIKLLNQGVVNYLDVSDTPPKAEEYLTRLMIQVEELEGRFAEFDEFVLQLSEKREEIYNAFETRKLALIEARNKRANSLKQAADRILKGIKTRVESFGTINEINGYFAGDLMIEKVRDIVSQLKELEDSVKVDEIQSALKTIREDAVRQLKDRHELYVEGENVIRLGTRLFSVNTQALDLTIVPRNDGLALHLTGTDFFETIRDPRLESARPVWNQEVLSENETVYRAEYLVYQILQDLRASDYEATRSGLPALNVLQEMPPAELLKAVTQYMGPRYQEGYVKGVHDQDAATLLRPLLEMEAAVGLLRFSPSARALARVYWKHFVEKRTEQYLAARCASIGDVQSVFPRTKPQADFLAEIRSLLQEWVEEDTLFAADLIPEAGDYLFQELSRGAKFVVSPEAAELRQQFQEYLHNQGFQKIYDQSTKALQKELGSYFELLQDWVGAFLDSQKPPEAKDFRDEIAALLMDGQLDPAAVQPVKTIQDVTDMIGHHAVIQQGKYHLNYRLFQNKLSAYMRDVVPVYQGFIAAKKEIIERGRDVMKLQEFQPKVLTSFVRNKLLNEVYLPVIGDNLAKQMGTVGEEKRTDRMGMLLLISPPGYGKTTLMEYIANRLGIIFMKINGPAIGHQVTSLDPQAAPNAGAKEEIEKLNLALEMGDNVMLYLDDIQHCNPEFLQKFISLCDAQRKIEGVYKGRTRTYDFRGRKVAVVMAGNPYTESGEKFKIPDMLANRADIYNLGEMVGDHGDAFKMSYLENCLTSNPVLQKLSSRSQADIYGIIKMAERNTREGIDLEGNYSLEEITEMTQTMQKLMTVRDVILRVNQEYIRSAAQADDYRTEPAFKLQGSYRNMNRIAEKVMPILNDRELQTLIVSNYENDAQTLTTGAEANLLKFREMTGLLTPEQQDRWNSIKKTFVQNNKLRGLGADQHMGQVLLQLTGFNDGLEGIRDTLKQGTETLARSDSSPALLVESLQQMQSSLQSIHKTLSNGSSPHAVPSAPSPRPEDQTITVVNRLPRSVFNVLQQQFELMKTWLHPLLEQSQHQTAQMEELQGALNQCLKDYRALLHQMSQGNEE